MKTTLILAAMLAGSTAAYAQDPPPATQTPAQAAPTSPAPPASTAPAQTASPAPAPPASTPPAQTEAASVPAPAKPAPPSPERLREVKVMESILANAVSVGATELARQMQATDLISMNPARARGIALDGYGVLFDVDVPLMNLSVVWTRQQMLGMDLRDRINNAKQFQARAASAAERDRFEAEIQLLTRTLEGLSPPLSRSATPVADSTQPAAAGSVVAQTVDVPPVSALDTRNTDQMYTDAIKKALIDAMVNHSSALMLTDNEWLLVAARDNGAPAIPGTIDDRSGIILRIRGSDLAAFRANKLTRGEVTKKVDILEWR